MVDEVEPARITRDLHQYGRCELRWRLAELLAVPPGTPFWLLVESSSGVRLAGRGSFMWEPAWEEASAGYVAVVAFADFLEGRRHPLPLDRVAAGAPGVDWNRGGRWVSGATHSAPDRVWRRWLCDSSQPGHNVDPEEALRIMAAQQPETGRLEEVGFYLWVRIDRDPLGVALDDFRGYWTHGLDEFRKLSAQERPLRLWRDSLMAVDAAEGEPTVVSVVRQDSARPCGRGDLLGACPHCGSGSVREFSYGFAAGEDDPNLEPGGCTFFAGDPEFFCAWCHCVWSLGDDGPIIVGGVSARTMVVCVDGEEPSPAT